MSAMQLRRSRRISQTQQAPIVETSRTRPRRLRAKQANYVYDDDELILSEEETPTCAMNTPAKIYNSPVKRNRPRKKVPTSPSSLMESLTLTSPQKNKKSPLVVISSDDELKKISNKGATNQIDEKNRAALAYLIKMGLVSHDDSKDEVDNCEAEEAEKSFNFLDMVNISPKKQFNSVKTHSIELISDGDEDILERVDLTTENGDKLEQVDLTAEDEDVLELIDLTPKVDLIEPSIDSKLPNLNKSEIEDFSPVHRLSFRQSAKILSSSEDEDQQDDTSNTQKVDLFSPPVKEKKLVKKSKKTQKQKTSISLEKNPEKECSSKKEEEKEEQNPKNEEKRRESRGVKTPRKEKSKPETHLGTPPKLRKIDNVENLPNAPPPTPNTLLEQLELNEKSPSRRKLFAENDLYKNARQALHSSYPTDMPGRQKEITGLREFIVNHLENGTCGTLYVSGPPGTGKTASLNLILQEEQISSQFKHVYVNCTAIKSSGSIFARIAKELSIKSNGRTEKDYIQSIEHHLNSKSHKTILLVLDEIDQLESKKQSVLYTIFEWPANPKSKLILIGIANALDLTDRILPRLQARCELKPELMHFAPYSKQQIVEIFTTRLRNAGVLDLFSPVAIQMLAGKVAAISGDVRRALDIGRRVIELVDRSEKEDNLLKSIENFTNQLDDKPKTVELKQVVNVLNNVYGTCQNFNDDVDDSFPLQQKIVVCSLVLMLKKAKNKDITIGRLHDVYRKVCTKRNIQVVDQGEFVGLCSLIETRGIIRVIKKKDPRMSKISLVWDEEEVGNALRDKQLLSTILQDDACLGKM